MSHFASVPLLMSLAAVGALVMRSRFAARAAAVRVLATARRRGTDRRAH